MTEDLTNKFVAWATEIATYTAQLPSRRARDDYLRALDQGVETILRIERIGKLDATQACAHNPPIAAGGRKRGISIVGPWAR